MSNFSTKLLEFLNSKNIKYKIVHDVDDCLMAGVCKIDNGVFLIEKSVIENNKNTHIISPLLHELGHFLSVPVEVRDNLTHDLRGISKLYISEYASRIIAYKLCIEFVVKPEVGLSIFMTGGYDRDYTVKTYKENAFYKFEQQQRYGCLATINYEIYKGETGKPRALAWG